MRLVASSLALLAGLAIILVLAISTRASGETSHEPAMHHHAMGMTTDPRQLVDFPPPMRAHTLANMRDHLLTVSEIQAALAAGRFDKAADLAEQRLGMSSLKLHGAHELSAFMPPAMRALGMAMHRNASAFAIEARNASVSGHVRPALRALSRVTQSCVACHAAYRLH